MSSICVLSPNAFNAQPVSRDSSTATNTSNSGRGMAMAHQFAQHPALRGWTSSSTTTLNENYSPTTANEVMRGSVTLLSSSQPQKILLSVIRTSVDHLALVYLENRRNLKCVKPAGCINLRGVTCEEIVLGDGVTGITLRPKKCDTSSSNLTFVCHEHVDKWIQALSHCTPENKIPKKCTLPSLEEEEE